MKHALFAILVAAGPAYAGNECKIAKIAFDEYKAAVNFALAVSVSCKGKTTHTCGEILEPLQTFLVEISKVHPVFLIEQKSNKCKD